MRPEILVTAAFAALLVAFVVVNALDLGVVPSVAVFALLLGLYVAARVYAVRRKKERSLAQRE
jgi:hypothetical protein